MSAYYQPMPSFLPIEEEPSCSKFRKTTSWLILYLTLLAFCPLAGIRHKDQLAFQFPDETSSQLKPRQTAEVNSDTTSPPSHPGQEPEPAATRRPSARTGRILARIYERELAELDPHLRTDLRIAWLTVLYAGQNLKNPHFVATQVVLGCNPNQVWPRILANRKAKLGPEYSDWYDESGNLRPDVPKKSSQPSPSSDHKEEIA